MARLTEVRDLDNLDLVLRAAVFAAEKHRGQVRKGAEAAPYILHPLAVARTLVEEGGVTDAEVIAARGCFTTRSRIRRPCTTTSRRSSVSGSQTWSRS